MGLVKTRRLAAMRKQQRAKAGMKLPTPPPARKCAPFSQQALKPSHTKSLPPKPVALPLLTRYVTYCNA